MTSRNRWRAGFLAVTALAIVMELVAAFDGRADTDPWTSLIVTYVPELVTYGAIGALVVWLPVHFWRRYRRRTGDRPVRYGTRRPGPPPPTMTSMPPPPQAPQPPGR